MSGEREHQYDGVDALIDEAARALTRSEPPVAQRARVRSSIAAAHRRSSAWPPVMAGAALVVIATAVVWRLPFTTEPVVPPSIPQRVQQSPAVPPTESQQTSREPAAGGPTERVARRRPETPAQATSVVFRGPLT